MSKHRSKKAHGRERVISSDIFTGTSVHAPLGGPIPDDKAGRQAAALQRALRVGGNLASQVLERRYNKAMLAGTKAQLDGLPLTEEESKRDAFVAGYTKSSTQADLIQMESDALTVYQTSKPEDLEAKLQELWEDRFSGLDPEDDLDMQTFKQAATAWQKITASIAVLERQDAAETLQQDQLDDYTIIARHQYEQTGEFNAQALNDDMRASAINHLVINDFIASTARDLAERNGDVSVLDDLPTQWASGAPAPGSIGKYRDGLRNSRRSADNQRIYNEAKQDAADDKAHGEWEDEQSAKIMLGILNGDDQSSNYPELLKGNMDPTEIRTLIRFEKAFKDNLNTGNPVDHDLVADIQADILNADYTRTDLNRHIASGDLGSGEELAANIVEISQQMRASESGRRNSNDFVASRNTLTAWYTSDSFTERNVPEIKQYRTRALRFWLELQGQQTDPNAAFGAPRTSPGLSPSEAEQKTMEEFPQRDPNAKSNSGTTVEQTIIGYSRPDSSFTDADVMAKKPANMSEADYLRSLLEFVDERVIERLREEIK